MASTEPRRSQLILGGYLVAVFGASTLTDLRLLGLCWLIGLLVLYRGAPRALRTIALTVLPFAGGLAGATWLWQRFVAGQAPDWHPLASLTARATLIGFVTVSVARRINLCCAVGFSQTLSRLLVIALAQIHALRLLATESFDGIRSRMLHKPTAGQLVRGAGAVTGTLLALSAKHSQDVADALRSRGM